METVPEPIEEPPTSPPVTAGVDVVDPARTTTAPPPRRRPRAPETQRAARPGQLLHGFKVALLAYLGSRALLLAVAIINGALRHHALTHELANWDGLWYRALANHGYPSHVSHAQTTLGFFPLYPLVAWTFSHLVSAVTPHSAVYSITVAGVIVSTIGGAVATVLVQVLASEWWGEQAGRRAAVLFCLFPGSVVFSMVYAEGIFLPLAAGCLLALQRRRWLTAGALAGVATATEPEAIVLILVCAVSAALELRRRGWTDPRARRSLLAPLLSTTGLVAVAGYLWAHTGTPFANLIAQRYGWHERTDPLAVVHLVTRLAHQISFSHFNHPTINLNLVVGLVGVVVLVLLLVLLIRARRQISPEAWVWTAGISFLALTSEYTPPNPRLLITAFPAVVVLAYYLRGRRFAWLLLANGILLAGLSALTFVGVTLRP